VFEIWSLLRTENPEIGKHAVQQTLSFVSTFRCEAVFPRSALIEAKQRTILDPEADFQVRLPNIKRFFYCVSQNVAIRPKTFNTRFDSH